MENQHGEVWVRTRVSARVKAWVQETAALLGWNIPGVEAAAISLVSAIMTPKEFANGITQSLSRGREDD